MASRCIESIHLNTQSSSSAREQSEKSCSSVSRANVSLIPSKKKHTINVSIACSNNKSQDSWRKLLTESMINSSCLSASSDTLAPPPSPPTAEKLDHWMKQSIIEIVRHIQDAPFLHYIFDKKSPSPSRWQKVPSTYISQQEEGEGWGMLRNCITSICPDGMIYVQKFNSLCNCEYCTAHDYSRTGEEGDSTDMWGLVIQGRGGGVTGSASYILKTTKIVSPNGCWTQFSLVRAKCFAECPRVQFIRSWLLQSHEV